MSKVLKNYPFNNISSVKEPIVICENDACWQEMYANWLAGKLPSNDPKWKEGVFMVHLNEGVSWADCLVLA